MRWNDQGQSNDVEDRRGSPGNGGSGGGRLRVGAGGFVVLLVLSVLFKKNFLGAALETGGTGGRTQGPAAAANGASEGPGGTGSDTAAHFASFVLDDVQNSWAQFPLVDSTQHRVTYERTKLVLFTARTSSPCGEADAATGPFYCPADRKVYLDLAFFDALRTRFRAAGDFAQAYVIAHEIGHHLQNLLGTEAKLRRDQRAQPSETNALSVKLELQADCYAGIWAHSTQQRKLLEGGDLEEALGAAAAIGDDRLQKAAGRAIRPESWTHGSSQQRSTWFRRGFDSGKLEACDTFR